LTLLVLLIAAATISLGPGTLVELISGVSFVRPQAASNAAAPMHADPQLQARLESVSHALTRGRLAAVAIDLKTGASANIDAERAYPAASLFKVLILLEVLAEEDSGQLDPDRLVDIRAEDWTDGSGVLQARVGDRLSVRELARLMIQESDNIAALALLDVTGIESVGATAERLGLHATRLVDHRAGETGDHTTSAGDMAQLLVRLATGQAINQHVSEQALGILELKQTVGWLSDELPFWVKVAHKWGDLPDARNDVGIVFTPRGSYVVAVLTQNAVPDEAASAVARVSRATYDYLGDR
jgi:beta-lactamase class A